MTRNTVALRLAICGPGVVTGVSGMGVWKGRQRLSISGRNGFTLIETILVVVLVALLLSLILPSLQNTKKLAGGARSSSNLRSHASVLAVYAADYDDLFPYLTDPKATRSVVRCESAGIAVSILYFEASRYWRIGLADSYYQGAWNSSAFFTPYRVGEGRAEYLLSCTTIADPRYYSSEEAQAPPQNLRPVRGTEVHFPSAKGLLVEHSFALPSVSPRVAFGDGSASVLQQDRFLAGLRSGDGLFWNFTLHYPNREPICHTVNGVRGRDVR
jgi:prepilin-type N-terminal cleavage/methylation domain-containing protein